MILLMQLDGVSQIDANDIDPKSVQAIERNIAYNGAAASDRVRTTQVSNLRPASLTSALLSIAMLEYHTNYVKASCRRQSP